MRQHLLLLAAAQALRPQLSRRTALGGLTTTVVAQPFQPAVAAGDDIFRPAAGSLAGRTVVVTGAAPSRRLTLIPVVENETARGARRRRACHAEIPSARWGLSWRAEPTIRGGDGRRWQEELVLRPRRRRGCHVDNLSS